MNTTDHVFEETHIAGQSRCVAETLTFILLYMPLKKNLVANYAGQIWVAIMGMAFIPIYIHYIGVESFGLIGLFGVLSAWFVLLDMGITSALVREMALFTSGAYSAYDIRQLLRSVELVIFSIAAVLFLSLYLSADWLASNWLKVSDIPIADVVLAFQVMGLVAAIRFIEGVYRSCILGLQRHVLYNSLNSFLATVRGLGAVLILAFVSPTIQAFFYWQAAISIITVIAFGFVTYNSLPSVNTKIVLSVKPLLHIYKFAGGMFVITILSLVLTQTDKLILSNLVSLSEYGHYTLAAMVSGVLYMFIAPITQTWYPRFVQYYGAGMQTDLVRSFHLSAQMVVSVSSVVSLTGAFFSEPLLLFWTRNETLSETVSPVLSLLFIGNLLNTLMYIPYQMQLAHGITRVTVILNSIMVIAIIPLIYLMVPIYGVRAAAAIWLGLNVAYVLIGAQYMFRYFLNTEIRKWYVNDIAAPIIACVLPLSAGYYLIHYGYGGDLNILIVVLSSMLASALVVLVAPQLRAAIIEKHRSRIAERKAGEII